MKTPVAKCAAEIRKLLKTKYPSVSFRVTSENFSMGNSVSIHYTAQFPCTDDVNKLVAPFKDGDFDGMDDSYTYRPDNGMPRAKYIHVSRHTAPSVREAIIRKYQLIDDSDTMKRFHVWMDQFIWQEDCRMSREAVRS